MPTHEQNAQVLINATQAIKNAVQQHGFGTITTMVLLTQLMKVTRIGSAVLELPEPERNLFYGEVWDAAIGNEPNALIGQVGIFTGDTLESMSDAMKSAALAYFNREVGLLPAPGETTA